MRQLLRIPNARLYLLGDVVSTLGDSALWLAMAIWMKELTGSSAAAGLVMFAYATGNLFSPLGGVLADRFRRRPLLICANLMAAALVLLIVLVHHRSQIWLVYTVIFGYGVIGSAMGPAQMALLPALVPQDLLAQANGAQQTLNQGLRLVTPLAGAGLFSLLGAAAVAEIDAVTFGVAVASLIALRVQEPGPGHREPEPGEGRAVTAGFRFIRAEPVLRSITIALTLAMLAFGFTESAGFSVVTAGLHHSASFVGVLMTTQGIGAVIGGLSAAAVLRRSSEGMMTAMGAGLRRRGRAAADPAEPGDGAGRHGHCRTRGSVGQRGRHHRHPAQDPVSAARPRLRRLPARPDRAPGAVGRPGRRADRGGELPGAAGGRCRGRRHRRDIPGQPA